MFVNGTCGPYTSLLTQSQAPTSSAGIMLPDGMRNASTKKVRMKRKISSAPAIDFTFSQIVAGSARFVFAFPRAAATVELFECCERLADAGGDAEIDAVPPTRARARLTADAVQHLFSGWPPVGSAHAWILARLVEREVQLEDVDAWFAEDPERTTFGVLLDEGPY